MGENACYYRIDELEFSKQINENEKKKIEKKIKTMKYNF